MTMAYDPSLSLPDPDTRPEFYRGTASKRLLAWMVDALVVLSLSFVASILTLGIGFFFFIAIATVVSFLYRWMTLAGGSATWGMRLMAIELREADGGTLQSSTALIHTAGYLFSCWTAPLQLISMVLMGVSGRGQGLSDMVLGTAAVNRILR